MAAHAALVFAATNGYDCTATPEDLVEVTLRLAEGRIAAEELAIWFRQRLRPSQCN